MSTASACPDPSALEAFGRGGLDAATRARIELHLDGCSGCAGTLATLLRLFASDDAQLQSTLAEPAVAHADASAVPLQVGRYRLGARIGAGAMGMVHEAVDPELHRRVAIKLLHPGITVDVELTRARMLREARAMAQLAHANVVAVHDVGRVGEQVFVAMELVDGTTLARWLEQRQRTLPEILAMFVQAGRGLMAAHAVGLVHRDFKPDNVLIGNDGRARVTDFGLARPLSQWLEAPGADGLLAHDGATGPSRSAPLGATVASAVLATAQGSIVGTPAYMAPEQWRGLPADARSDQFAFCVALYHACFGARPFAGDGVFALAESVLQGRLRPPPRSAPAWLRQALLQGLASDPAARHASMAELLAALERDRSRRMRAAGMVGAMALGVGGTVAVLAWLGGVTAPAPASTLALPSPTEVAPTTVEGATATAPAGAPTPSVDECRARAADLDGRWDAPRREALRSALSAMDDGAAVVARVMPVLDRFADTHRQLATAACDPGLADAPVRLRCLARMRGQLDAFVQRALDLPRFQVVDAVAHGALTLPDPRRCGHERWLRAEPSAPPPDDAAAIAVLDGELAAAEALVRLDRYGAAPAAIEDVLTRARERGFTSLAGRAELALGLAHAERGATDLAIAQLEAAATTATAGHDDTVRVAAAVALVEVLGPAALRPVDAGRWADAAAAIVARIDDATLRGELALARGLERAALSDPLAAVASLDAATDALRTAVGEDHPTFARARLARAAAALVLDDPATARRESDDAVASLARSVGPEDLRYGAALAVQARVRLVTGDATEAQRSIEAAISIAFPSESLRHDFDRGRWLGVLGEIQRSRGDLDAAAKSFEDAMIYLYVEPEKALPLSWQGALAIERGATADGLARLDAALAAAVAGLGEDDPRLVPLLSDIGRAQRRAGAIAAARRSFERAVGLAEAHFGFAPATALAQWDLAELERADGHDARALELFDDVYVPLVGAFGQHHWRVRESTLARADLAWALGQHAYGGRLYDAIVAELEAAYGPADPRAQRARSRRRPEP